MNYIGLDVGTSMIKGQLFSEQGVILSSSERPSPTKQENGVSVLCIRETEEAVFSILRDLSSSAGGDVSSICFSSLGEAFALIDENGDPLNDFILFVSSLGEEETEEATSRMDAMEIAKTAGCYPNRMYSFSKLMWLKKSQPEAYRKAKFFLLVSSYMAYRLTGVAKIDYSLAARTMLLDVRNRIWANDIIAACGLDEGLFPPLCSCEEVLGCVTEEASHRSGLPTTCKVLASGHDQLMAAIGSGIKAPGMANDGTGTAECLTVAFEGLPESELFYANNYAAVPYVLPNVYLTYAFLSTGGALLKWHRDALCPMERDALQKKGNDFYAEYSSKPQKLPTSLLILPHFDGTGTPYLDTKSTGAILGLTQRTQKEEIYFALMEGASYEIKLNIAILKQSGVRIQSMSATGGGAKSPAWLSIKSNVYRKKIRTLSSPEGGLFGCFLCCKRAETSRSFESLMSEFVQTKKLIVPNKILSSEYRRSFAKYKRLYSLTKKLWR